MLDSLESTFHRLTTCSGAYFGDLKCEQEKLDGKTQCLPSLSLLYAPCIKSQQVAYRKGHQTHNMLHVSVSFLARIPDGFVISFCKWAYNKLQRLKAFENKIGRSTYGP
jgi:hypothetical protein